MAWRPINIEFKDREVTHVDAEAFSNWFPTSPLLVGSTYLSGETLVRQLHEQIESVSPIGKSTIRLTLSALFERLRYKPFPIAKESRRRVMEDLESLLRNDLYGSVIRNGLMRSRQCFVILANLAQMTDSTLLTEALMTFCQRNMHDIMSNERHEHLHQEWRLALHQIQHLATASMFQGLPSWILQHGYHSPWREWHRGRVPNRVGLPWPGARASSTPAIHRRQSPDYRMIPFSEGLATQTPPLMSPIRMLDTSPFDEVEALHYNQHQLADKLQTLERDIAMLKHGY